MSARKKRTLSLEEKLRLWLQAGIKGSVDEADSESQSSSDADPLDDVKLLPDLKQRIQKLLHIVKAHPMKATDMLSLIMYDIEDNRVRNIIARYLIRKGCIRIQKSVYFLRAHHRVYKEIAEALKQVQASYDNQDSIILVPIPHDVPGSMQIIGKEIHITRLVDHPNTLFF